MGAARRILLPTGGLLVLGAVATFAVAAWLHSGMTRWCLPGAAVNAGGAYGVRVYAERGSSWVAWTQNEPGRSTAIGQTFPWSPDDAPADRDAGDVLPAWTRFEVPAPDAMPAPFRVERASGWPYRAVRSVVTAPTDTGPFAVEGGIELRPGALGRLPVVIPTRVLVAGFAANTVIAALALTLPAWLWRTNVQLRRRRDGRCPRCGYDLRGVGAVCPECGSQNR